MYFNYKPFLKNSGALWSNVFQILRKWKKSVWNPIFFAILKRKLITGKYRKTQH